MGGESMPYDREQSLDNQHAPRMMFAPWFLESVSERHRSQEKLRKIAKVLRTLILLKPSVVLISATVGGRKFYD
jgi:hypothetical protein